MKNKEKAILCALMLMAGTLHFLPEKGEENGQNITEINEIAYEESIYSGDAEKLYNEVKSKLSINNWNKEIALKVVELLKGHYPTAMTYMNTANADDYTKKAIEALTEIIRTNLDPKTSSQNMVNLANYVEKQDDKSYLSNALSLGKKFTTDFTSNHRIGEARWDSSERFYDSAVELLNFEYNTNNNNKFLQMPAGSRLAIQTIFNEANKYVPEEAFVNREASEITVREHKLYWLYFQNNMEKKAYLPRRTSDNKIVFVYTNEYCYDEEVYTKEEMYALAGLSSFEEQRRLGIEPKLWIWQMGIQTEIDNRIDDATQEIYNMTRSVENRDAKVMKK